ncbi:thioredoxin family protein [Pseudoprimorskyibacter insulae]|uniref:Thioredoxin n=1 Tax=Pseudoprimorskyibacter insulae TaxID=1695997 RepID=A0A2R8AVA9_9RHOB|nr:thioredoxin family protein [Pseudoprimorskyibacter insulae]SPF79819.1 Thioredoxin [Pseudoprimorskyibacter insulae]
MHRRLFLASGLAAALPLRVWAAAIDYTPGLVQTHLAKGDTVFLDFKASWCSTCAAQERVLNKLKADNPAYESKITFINVDWDEYRSDALTKGLKIPRRSTLVVLKGDKELGRIVAQTDPKVIKALMDTALNAA